MNGRSATDEGDRDIDLIAIALGLWARKYTVLIGILVGLVIATCWMRFSPRLYTSELRVTPAPSSQSISQPKAGGLGGLASLAGLSIDASSSATPFDSYIDALTSRDVANELARDPRILQTIFRNEWDTKNHEWRRPRNAVEPVLDVLKSILGVAKKPWVAPNGARLQIYLKRSVSISKRSKEGITTISFDARDPAFATYVLEAINSKADLKVRRSFLSQARQYVAYLSARLPTILVAEHRLAIAESLGDQERMIMMASSDLPFAAKVMEAPTASLFWTKPNAVLVLLAGLLGGLALGALVALVDPSALKSSERA